MTNTAYCWPRIFARTGPHVVRRIVAPHTYYTLYNWLAAKAGCLTIRREQRVKTVCCLSVCHQNNTSQCGRKHSGAWFVGLQSPLAVPRTTYPIKYYDIIAWLRYHFSVLHLLSS